MRPDFSSYRKLSDGDRVAVVSPSFAAPALYPAVHELAMRRLADDFGVRAGRKAATGMNPSASEPR